MNKYNNGKIYKIIDNTNGNIYIGSTTKTLKYRLERHLDSNCISKDIIKNNNYKIELIEDYPCNNKKELLIREQYYINNLKCINIRNAYTDQKKYMKKYNKEYYNNNKNQKKEYNKKYIIKNKDKILNQKKEYYNNNKDKILNQNKKYYNNNKDKLNIKKKELRIYKNSFGGDKRFNNNLLEIDLNIFM